MSLRKFKFVAGVLVVIAAIGILVGVSIQGNMAYFVEVDDYLARDPQELERRFRIRGNVVPGTIQKEPGKLGAVFAMAGSDSRMTVRYGKELPDTFKDMAEVVVEGAMGSGGVFEAHSLNAKCPSKYEAAEKAGEANPHTPS